MELYDELNIGNLYSLYNLVGAGNSNNSLVSQQEYGIVKTPGSAWPNLAFVNDINAVTEVLIADITSKMLQMEMKPLIFAGANPEVVMVLRKQGYMPVEQMLGMYYDLAENKKKKEFYSDVFILREPGEFDQWTKLISVALFGSGELQAGLFNFLAGKNCDLVGIKHGSELAGASLVYYDNAGNAGLYMVAVKEPFRGKGLAKRMIDFCIGLIWKKNINTCYLQATRMAIDLYNTMGFKSGNNFLLYLKVK